MCAGPIVNGRCEGDEPFYRVFMVRQIMSPYLLRLPRSPAIRSQNGWNVLYRLDGLYMVRADPPHGLTIVQDTHYAHTQSLEATNIWPSDDDGDAREGGENCKKVIYVSDIVVFLFLLSFVFLCSRHTEMCSVRNRNNGSIVTRMHTANVMYY